MTTIPLERDYDENSPLVLKISNERGITKYLIDINYKSDTFKFSIPVDQNISWIMIAEYAFKQYLLKLENGKYNSQRFLNVHSLTSTIKNKNKVDLHSPIRFSHLASYLFPTTFILRMEGPISSFDINFLVKIVEIYLPFPKILNSLIKVSKKFNRSFSCDQLWSVIKFKTFSPWLGIGSQGSDDEIWQVYRFEKGLPVINCSRLRWIFHNSSRMKIFYGLQKNKHVSFFEQILSMNNSYKQNEYENNIQKKITILSVETKGYSIGRIIINALNHIIPSSSKSFQTNALYKPILETSIYISNESIVNNNNNNNNKRALSTKLEGVIVESENNYNYRRIGDSRVTFIQLDIPMDNNLHINCRLIRNSIGNIICIQNSDDIAQMKSELRVLLKLLLLSRRECFKCDRKNRFDHNYFNSMSPILIYLLINGNNISSLENTVLECDYEVKLLIEELIKSKRLNDNNNIVYYVQPISVYNNQIIVLKRGFLNGINWLIRSIDDSG